MFADLYFFFNCTATTEIYTYRHTLSLHDAAPSWGRESMDATTSDPLGDGCPMHQQGAIRSLLGRTSRDWWPNQLSLDILHQHGRSGNPLGDDFDYRKAFEATDYAGVKSSEARRVGKEWVRTCKYRGLPEHEKN